MALIANDILIECSYAVLEPIVDTTIAAGVSSGAQTVAPADGIKTVRNLYVGCKLIIGRGTAEEEVVTVSALSTITAEFTATFANTHAGPAGVVGAIFSKGQDNRPLFTQAEMLDYLQTGQNDFLTRVRPLYKSGTVSLTLNTTVFAQPADCIRLERLAVAGYEIPDTSQANLDMTSSSWPSEDTETSPRGWFQDKVDTNNFGIVPQLSGTVDGEVWYSQKETATLALDTEMLCPIIFCHYLKYYVLFKAFSKDGEQRDPLRADFCYFLFSMGVYKAKKFMEGLGAGDRPGIPPMSQLAPPAIASPAGGAPVSAQLSGVTG